MADDSRAILSQMIERASERYPQFRDFVDAQNELIASGACLLGGASFDEDRSHFLRLVAHVERLWEVAALLFKSEAHPPALYLAIATIEEVGKIGVSRIQLALRQEARERGVEVTGTQEVARRGNPFFSHPQKHLLAAGAGVIVNNRLERIVGKQAVATFLEGVRSGHVEKLRQAALYADLGENGPILPNDMISREKACLYVVIAGELMAEVLGFEPAEWERLLERVQEFEKAIGHDWK